jgi:8-amino-7-oxononanoate synthase
MNMPVLPEKSLQRQRRFIQENTLNFCSNDYLALSHHPKMIASAKAALDQFGVGGKSSQLVSGHTVAHQEFEIEFARFVKRDRAILFGNGYMANLGVLKTLCQRKNAVFQDRNNHASLIDAGILSRAEVQRFRHKDMDQLENLLIQSTSKNKFIVSDSVFSTSGDIAPVSQLAKLATQYSATLMIDDAHGIGVLGENGAGITEENALDQKALPILVCPLGKAFATQGAMVAGSSDLIESLIQGARTYIYTTALPPAFAVAGLQSLNLIREEKWRREKLRELINFFSRAAAERN